MVQWDQPPLSSPPSLTPGLPRRGVRVLGPSTGVVRGGPLEPPPEGWGPEGWFVVVAPSPSSGHWLQSQSSPERAKVLGSVRPGVAVRRGFNATASAALEEQRALESALLKAQKQAEGFHREAKRMIVADEKVRLADASRTSPEGGCAI